MDFPFHFKGKRKNGPTKYTSYACAQTLPGCTYIVMARRSGGERLSLPEQRLQAYTLARSLPASEDKFQPQLQDARRTIQSGNTAEIRQVSKSELAGSSKIGMVERIKCLEVELKIHVLIYGKVLEEG